MSGDDQTVNGLPKAILEPLGDDSTGRAPKQRGGRRAGSGRKRRPEVEAMLIRPLRTTAAALRAQSRSEKKTLGGVIDGFFADNGKP